MIRVLLALLSVATLANAHFVFVVPQPDGAKAHVFISEELKPSNEVDVAIVASAKLSLRGADGKEQSLTMTRSGTVYSVPLPGEGTRVVHGIADLGLTQRGQDKPHLLTYYPKTIVGDAFDTKTIVGDAPIEIVPIGHAGEVRLKVLAHGEPLAKSEVTVIFPDATQRKMKTDDAGLTEALTQQGRFGAWARYWEKASGERDGKAYEQVRNYATLVFDATNGSSTAASAFAKATTVAKLPEATASFGAVVNDGWLYVYGGHIAPTHDYSTAAVSGRFSRLNLAEEKTWEDLPPGPALQGMNLAVYKGHIYRIGGMEPRNKPGDKSATFSIPENARFDVKTKTWEPLPSLPEARSSHDVVVIGDKLIVVGGWALNGPKPSVWLDSLAILDLSAPKLEWKSAKQPFKRRALIATSYLGKLYVLGGFDERGRVVKNVSIYDPAADTWTEGSALPATNDTDGFAPAACVQGDSLFVSLANGGLYRLDQSKQSWIKFAEATPRVAHRIVSDGKTILVMGGADNGKNSDLIEAVDVR